MDNDIQYKTSEAKHDWFSTHVLSKEQVAQLIQNKIDRARIYQKSAEQVKKLIGYDWWSAWIGNENRNTAQNV